MSNVYEKLKTETWVQSVHLDNILNDPDGFWIWEDR